MVRLTHTVKTSGCASKLPVGDLNAILSTIPPMEDEKLLVGFETSDDALCWDLGDGRVMVQSVDFFPPVADEPYDYGRIAAANALSDIYAMGARPAVAMNIMCFCSHMDLEVMRDILLGAQETCRQAGCVIAGGHTIADATIKFGLSVTGFTTRDRLWTNRGARAGDVIVLTKRIGVGVANTMIKAGEADAGFTREVLDGMMELNRSACELASSFDVHAATDITGFSLLGHLYEMAHSSGLTIEIDSSAVPVYPQALEGARFGFIPQGAYSNRDYLEDKVLIDEGIDRALCDLFFDPQTSGPLALAMDPASAEDFVSRFSGVGAVIGRCLPEREKAIVVRA